jgi:hypothetical protein
LQPAPTESDPLSLEDNIIKATYTYNTFNLAECRRRLHVPRPTAPASQPPAPESEAYQDDNWKVKASYTFNTFSLEECRRQLNGPMASTPRGDIDEEEQARLGSLEGFLRGDLTFDYVPGGLTAVLEDLQDSKHPGGLAAALDNPQDSADPVRLTAYLEDQQDSLLPAADYTVNFIISRLGNSSRTSLLAQIRSLPWRLRYWEGGQQKKLIADIAASPTNPRGSTIRPKPGSVYVYTSQGKHDPVYSEDGKVWHNHRSSAFKIKGQSASWRCYYTPVAPLDMLRKHVTYHNGRALVYYYLPCTNCNKIFGTADEWSIHKFVCGK